MYNVSKICANNVVHKNKYLYEVIKWLRYKTILVLKCSLIVW